MLIDKSHRVWMLLTVFATALSAVLYLAYAANAPQGPQGGTWQGLLFGVVGSALMVFAGLLAGRKKVPRWRIGTARFWLKSHLWLGLLSVPMILFHAGFHWGGLLEQLLLAVFAVVILSGLAGVLLQQYLPRHMKETTSREAMFEQIPHVCAALRDTADAEVLAACGTLFPPDPNGISPGVAEAAAAAPNNNGELLRKFYVDAVRPFLASGSLHGRDMANASRAESIFAQVRQSLSPGDASTRKQLAVLRKLAAVCDERRDLDKQARLYRWLHLWLFVHIPLSLTLLVLGIAHAIASVYY